MRVPSVLCLVVFADSACRQARRRSGGYWRSLQDPLHFSLGMLFACLASATSDLPSQHKNASESDLRREFESFGSIERVRIVRDKNGRSRGYAFIVFERERDMKGTTFSFLFCAHSPSIPLRAGVAGVTLFHFQLRTRNRTASTSWASAFLSTSSVVAQSEDGSLAVSVAAWVVGPSPKRRPSLAVVAAAAVPHAVASGVDSVAATVVVTAVGSVVVDAEEDSVAGEVGLAAAIGSAAHETTLAEVIAVVVADLAEASGQSTILLHNSASD